MHVKSHRVFDVSIWQTRTMDVTAQTIVLMWMLLMLVEARRGTNNVSNMLNDLMSEYDQTLYPDYGGEYMFSICTIQKVIWKDLRID